MTEPGEDVIAMAATDAGVTSVTQWGAVAYLSLLTWDQQDRDAEDGGA